MAPVYAPIGGWKLVEVIGGGGFATVYRAVQVEEDKVAACKLISITAKTTTAERDNVMQEMRIQKALRNHENVLKLMGYGVSDWEDRHHYVPGFYVYLELAAGGDLFDKIAPDVGIEETVAQHYFLQLVAGMCYIHSKGICHRDLKPENVLLDAAGTLKISDFGLSKAYRDSQGRVRPFTDKCGSVPYMAPEILSSKSYAAEPIDVWGVGVILFAMLVGNTPWDEPTARSQEFRHYFRDIIFNQDPWDRLSIDALSLIRGMLCIDPRKRTKMTSISSDPWCTRPSQVASQSVSQLADMLTKSLRISGDLDLANPDDGSHQFTQSLLLFSQTSEGVRYMPNLTRFYTSNSSSSLIELITTSLALMETTNLDADSPHPGRIRHKHEHHDEEDTFRLRVSLHDERKLLLNGWIDVEPFEFRGFEGSFVMMRRDKGNPISWRRLWKRLIVSPLIEPHVLRKKQKPPPPRVESYDPGSESELDEDGDVQM